MKKFLVIMTLLLVLGVIGFMLAKEKVKNDLARPIPYPTNTPKPPTPTPAQVSANISETKSLFVPYWTLSDQLIENNYDQVIYFGLTPGKEGIDVQDQGSTQLQKFVESVPPGTTMLLAVRMTEADSNLAILDHKNKQKDVIDDSIALAKRNNFDGIVLDLELAALPFDSLKGQINTFTSSFYKAAKKDKLSFEMTMYGDTFYRLRPFDVKTLSKNTDSFLIMAYDFHKSRGNPGPNFPLNGQESYGYDMTEMVNDFLKFVPAQKLTVVFGLFGYDWAVDSKGDSIAQGKPITYNELNQKFISSCQYKNCSVDRDSTSSELEINYTDASGSKHTIWSEDMESVNTKKEYLKRRGIGSFSFWAYSYF
jgi:spore germination protein YaaH